MLIYIATFLIVYVSNFKSDFSDEHINKILPVLGAFVFFVVFLLILGLIRWGAN